MSTGSASRNLKILYEHTRHRWLFFIFSFLFFIPFGFALATYVALSSHLGILYINWNWYNCLGNRSLPRKHTSSMTPRLREQRIIQHLIYRIYQRKSHRMGHSISIAISITGNLYMLAKQSKLNNLNSFGCLLLELWW